MIPVCRPHIPEHALESLAERLASGWLGYGPQCRSLEKQFTDIHQGWALATSSCTSALFLAARLCRQTEDDEVICPAITFVSTAMAFIQAGWKVTLADVNANNLLITKQSIEERITDRTRAVVVVHLYGQKASTEEIKELCIERKIILIEDCAHRLDLLDESLHFGDYACYSFNAVKEAPCGEGGLLWGQEMDQRERALALSNVGLGIDTWQRSNNLHHNDYSFTEEVGLKIRLNDLLASLVINSLNELSQGRLKRTEIFRNYNQEFLELRPLVEPLLRGPEDSCLMYVVKLNQLNKERFRAICASKGVATSTHYPSLTTHPLFLGQRDHCPTAASTSASLVTLPCYLDMTAAEQKYVIETVKQAVRQSM